MGNQLVVTVRRSRSVIGRFNVYLEQGQNRTKLQAALSEQAACRYAVEKSLLMRCNMITYLHIPDTVAA